MESLGLMAGGIAHDFNNLFQALMGHLEMARQLSDPDGRASLFLDRALGLLENAVGLSLKMWEYSGKSLTHLEPLDLGLLAREQVELLANVDPRFKTVRLVVAKGLSSVRGDSAQLRQVLKALLINAGEAIGEGNGAIRVTVGSQILDHQACLESYWMVAPTSGEKIFLEVADEGCGIAPEVIGRMFDPFFTTKESGRGLGLSAVLGILRGHHAGLQVVSEEGNGSCFRIYFPRSNPKDHA
jgi:signal transduction histidine kinase